MGSDTGCDPGDHSNTLDQTKLDSHAPAHLSCAGAVICSAFPRFNALEFLCHLGAIFGLVDLLLVVRTGAGNLLAISNILTWDSGERASSIEGINIKEFGKSGW